MRNLSIITSVAIASIAAATLVGCTATDSRATSCAAYVQYQTLAEAAKEADLVARASVTHEKNPLEIKLIEVAKGSLTAGESLTVSAPSNCDPVSLPTGSNDLVVILVKHGTEWAPINTDQGLTNFNRSQFDSLR